MSYDLYFWPRSATDDPGQLVEDLADDYKADELEADPALLAFRADLLTRWPELKDRIEPWHQDLGGRQPWGPTDLADRFVILTLAFGWPHTEELPGVARQYGLDCYDPQFEEFV